MTHAPPEPPGRRHRDLPASGRALPLGATAHAHPRGRPAGRRPAALPADLDLGDLYAALLRHRAAWFAEVVAEIADGLPALVHCAAGKDRTGMVVALILDLLGLSEALGAAGGVPAALLDAPESAMRTFLTTLDELGGAEKFLLAHGLTAARIQRLRAALLP
ncbi:tyrosine-protein phosphatase [Actinomadura sp. ATCC 39365]